MMMKPVAVVLRVGVVLKVEVVLRVEAKTLLNGSKMTALLSQGQNPDQRVAAIVAKKMANILALSLDQSRVLKQAPHTCQVLRQAQTQDLMHPRV